MTKWLLFFVVFSLVATQWVNGGEVALFVNPSIEYSDDSGVVGKFAAEELTVHWKKITGRENDGEKKIILKVEQIHDGGEENFSINIQDEEIIIVGHSPRAMLYGVYELLEQIGVRWYRPDEWGHFIPKLEQIELAVGSKDYSPSFQFREGINSYRWWQVQTPDEKKMAGLWATRNRINTNTWTAPEMGGYYYIEFQHSYYLRLPQAQYLSEHPEYYALIDGKRSTETDAQLCLSNPEVQKIFIESILEQKRKNPNLLVASADPNDFGFWCECDSCCAWDDPELIARASGKVSKSNRVTRFNRIVLDEVNRIFPDLKLGALAYWEQTEAPSLILPHPNQAIRAAAFAAAYSDYKRAIDDPASSANSAFLAVLDDWQGKCSNVFIYEYYGGYAWPGPLPLAHRMQERLAFFAQRGIKGIYSETHPSWGPQGFELYLYPKLLWNVDIDVDLELELYCRNYYGPAATAMLEYHQLIARHINDGNQEWGSGGYGLEMAFSADLLEKLGKLLTQAQDLIGDDKVYSRRLEGVAAGYRFTRLVAAFLAAEKNNNVPEMMTASRQLIDYYDHFVDGSILANGKQIEGSRPYIIRARKMAK